jgi:hypothetical protein
MRRTVPLTTAFVLAATLPARAQAPPSPAEYLGHGIGASFTDAARAVSYCEALAGASPRVRLVRYGETVEGRDLVLLVIAPERVHGRLEEILATNARLADPALPPAAASDIARGNPAVAWLSYGIHGNESASTEAALWTAWDLATDAPEARGVLDSVIVVIDPVANPDGRDRYVQWYRGTRGRYPNPDPGSREHRPPWPSGRYNHYLFDLNRDWMWATQEETRARLRQWGRWTPQVHVDFHEMSFESTYFFFPAAEPVNPLLPDYTMRWAEYYGRANAAEFDRRRWLYYTGERFDLFYPGYGDSWPSLVGAIGMTYEQAGGGGAGLSVRRSDGTLLTLEQRATRHRVAGLTTLRATAARKTQLLTEFAAFHRGQGEEGDVLLVPGPEPDAATALIAVLQVQGIRADRASRPFRATARPHPGFAERQEFPIGTLRVTGRQSRWRLARTLLQPETELGESVSETYDITAWSLPYGFGVEAHTASGVEGGGFEAIPVVREAVDEEIPREAYGWLVAPSFEMAGPLFRYLEKGGRALALRASFEQAGTKWPAGTVFIPWAPDAPDELSAAGLGSLVRPVDSGRTASGRDLGTGASLIPTAARIGVLSGEGIRATSFGSIWHLLDVQAGIPFDALEASSLSPMLLTSRDVLVLPAGSPERALGDGADALVQWVRNGGTLVTLGSSTRWAAGAVADVEVRSSDGDDVTPADQRRLGLRTLEERRSDAWDDSVTGIILPLVVDAEHPLAWGAGRGNEAGALFAFHREDLVLEPDAGFETVASFGAGLAAVSGAVSARKLAAIAESSWLAVAKVGRGKVIMFTDDPLFRLMWRSNYVMFTNALLYGPRIR